MAIPKFETREVVYGTAADLPFDFYNDDDSTERDVSADTVTFTAFSDAAAGTPLFTVTATNDALTYRKIVSLTTTHTASGNVGKWYAELARKVGGIVKEKWIGTLVIAGPR